jgi:hypothetical protein
MIVGLSGKAQSGKDTVGAALVNKHEFIRVASADALKRIAMRTFGWDGEKDARGRKFLQDLATAVRGYDPDFWINITLKEIQRQNDSERNNKNFVITDLRYTNEANSLKKAGAILIRIEREGIELFDHESETQLDNYDGFDYLISNNDSISKLEQRVETILNRIVKKNEKETV